MGVKTEISRMILYLSFPVGMFWLSNQAEYFEEYVVKRKRELYPHNEALRIQEFDEVRERLRARREQHLLKEMSSESEK